MANKKKIIIWGRATGLKSDKAHSASPLIGSTSSTTQPLTQLRDFDSGAGVAGGVKILNSRQNSSLWSSKKETTHRVPNTKTGKIFFKKYIFLTFYYLIYVFNKSIRR